MAQIQEIHSWVAYGTVSGNRISLELPEELDAQDVQIIIIPQKKPMMSIMKDGKRILCLFPSGISQKTMSG